MRPSHARVERLRDRLAVAFPLNEPALLTSQPQKASKLGQRDRMARGLGLRPPAADLSQCSRVEPDDEHLCDAPGGSRLRRPYRACVAITASGFRRPISHRARSGASPIQWAGPPPPPTAKRISSTRTASRPSSYGPSERRLNWRLTALWRPRHGKCEQKRDLCTLHNANVLVVSKLSERAYDESD